MTSFKKLNDMIELHNNTEFKIESQKKTFKPKLTFGKKSLLSSAVMCNNFEAFKILVNHQSFLATNNVNTPTENFIYLIIRKFETTEHHENRRFFDELINCGYKFNIDIVKACLKWDTISYLLNNSLQFDISKLLKESFSTMSSNTLDTQVRLLNYVLENHANEINKDIIDNNVLEHLVIFQKISIIEVLYKNNIDIFTYKNKNTLIQLLKNYIIGMRSFKASTYSDAKDIILYFHNKNHKYNQNLLTYNFFENNNYNGLYDRSNSIKALKVIFDNFEMIKNLFQEVQDNEFNFFNKIIQLIMRFQINNAGYDYYYNLYATKGEEIQLLHHLINHVYKNVNLFEKLNNVSLNLMNTLQKTSDKDSCRNIIGVLLAHNMQPNEEINKIIKKILTEDEVNNIQGFIESYKEVKVVETPKKKGKKVNIVL